MKFVKYFPAARLQPYIKYFAVSENDMDNEYKVFPSSGMVIGFQYRGQLSTGTGDTKKKLCSAGITGICNRYKIFNNSPNTGTVLVYFTETGFFHFASHPANELFDLSIALDDVFDKDGVAKVEEKLATADTDKTRIKIIEDFLFSQLRAIEIDRLIVEAIRLIYQRNGIIRIKDLNEMFCISQSPFEKRFRKLVGTTPKKFASIVRFNCIIDNLNEKKTLTQICYENSFFDQSHFIKEFKRFTGDTPENFKRTL